MNRGIRYVGASLVASYVMMLPYAALYVSSVIRITGEVSMLPASKPAFLQILVVTALVAFPLSILPFPFYLIASFRRGRGIEIPSSEVYGWPIAFAAIAIVSGFVFAAVTRLQFLIPTILMCGVLLVSGASLASWTWKRMV